MIPLQNEVLRGKLLTAGYPLLTGTVVHGLVRTINILQQNGMIIISIIKMKIIQLFRGKESSLSSPFSTGPNQAS